MAQESYTKVIACGHRNITVKSGNLFPAFLIRFPSLGSPSTCAGNQGDADSQAAKFCYFWRSKRDFLLLNRSLQKYDSSKAFPKSAFSKLCNHAIPNEHETSAGPWVRPDDDEAPAGGYSELLCRLLSSYESNTSDVRALPSTPINFDPRLKKSLHMVDSFLRHAQDLSRLVNIGSEKESQCSDYSNDFDRFVNAWTFFCRKQDTDGLAPEDYGCKYTLFCQISGGESFHHVSGEKSTLNAARLGQYFASQQNAKLVVDTALQLINDLHYISRNVVFVEPSCGDGRLIVELLNSRPCALNVEGIIGYDIDPSVVEKCRQNLETLRRSMELMVSPLFKCTNFLSLSKQDLALDLATNHRVPVELNRSVIVVGGPPYTPKDLPEQFILHSIQELHADIVVFILPRRCKKDAVVIQERLNSGAIQKARWCFVNTDLADNTFDFEGHCVSQPSSLQYWYQG